MVVAVASREALSDIRRLPLGNVPWPLYARHPAILSGVLTICAATGCGLQVLEGKMEASAVPSTMCPVLGDWVEEVLEPGSTIILWTGRSETSFCACES